MITLPSDTTVLTNENCEVLIAILEEMRNCLSSDLSIDGVEEIISMHWLRQKLTTIDPNYKEHKR